MSPGGLFLGSPAVGAPRVSGDEPVLRGADTGTHVCSPGQVRGSGVSVLSESRDSVIGGVRGRLGVDVGSLGCFFGGLRVAVIEGVGGYEVSGLLQARQRHVALLLDPIIMLLG